MTNTKGVGFGESAFQKSNTCRSCEPYFISVRVGFGTPAAYAGCCAAVGAALLLDFDCANAGKGKDREIKRTSNILMTQFSTIKFEDKTPWLTE